ncbi:hypothetical protein ABT086_15740 [Streptomyces mirabilis]
MITRHRAQRALAAASLGLAVAAGGLAADNCANPYKTNPTPKPTTRK